MEGWVKYFENKYTTKIAKPNRSNCDPASVFIILKSLFSERIPNGKSESYSTSCSKVSGISKCVISRYTDIISIS